MLAAYVTNHLLDANMACSYYFFRHDDKKRAKLSHCLRSLAYQMAIMNPSIRANILATLNDTELDVEDFRSIWRRVFVGCIFECELKQPVFWVIDALDECNNNRDLVNFLCKIEESFPLKVFLTCRSGTDLGKHFTHLRMPPTTESINLNTTMQDIEVYVWSTMEDLPFDDENDNERIELIRKLLQKADGCFLWVKLVVEELSQVFQLEDIKKILEDVPSGVEPLYERTLVQMSTAAYGRRLAKAILTWTVCSIRPLTVDELHFALRLDIADKITNLRRSIEALCGNLVYVDAQDRVQMIHQTAREFLLRRSSAFEFGIDKNEGHGRLAEVCLNYLTSSEMQAPRGRRKNSAYFNQNRSPFAHYTSTAFYEHLVFAHSKSEILFDQLTSFLKSQNILA